MLIVAVALGFFLPTMFFVRMYTYARLAFREATRKKITVPTPEDDDSEEEGLPPSDVRKLD